MLARGFALAQILLTSLDPIFHQKWHHHPNIASKNYLAKQKVPPQLPEDFNRAKKSNHKLGDIRKCRLLRPHI